MQKSLVVNKVKSILNELLSPGTDEITVTLADHPIESYIDELGKVAVREIYKTLPPSKIRPYTIEWAFVRENYSAIIQYDSSVYDITNVSVDSFSGQGVCQVVEITNIDDDTYDNAPDYFVSGQIFRTTAAGEMQINAEGDTFSASINDTFIFFNDRFYCITPYREDDFEIGDYLLCCAAPDDDDGYFKNITLSDGTYLPLVNDGYAYAEETTHSPAELGVFDDASDRNWPKSSSDDFISYYAPKELVTISSMMFDSWETNKPKIIYQDSPEYRKQKNTYTKSGYIKPTVAITKEDSELFSIEVYSRKDDSDELSYLNIVQIVPIWMVQDDLVDLLSYLIAFHYLVAIGNNKAQTVFETYKMKLEQA